jgi:hypothetical protein
VRWILYGVILLVGIYNVFPNRSVLMSNGSPEIGWGADFHIYYEAGRGNFYWAQDNLWILEKNKDKRCEQGFFYPRWTANFWYWCRWVDFKTAVWIWYIFLSICYCLFVRKIFSYARNEYGQLALFFIVLSSIKIFSINMQMGNITPMVAWLLLSPAGCILAGCFKPWAIGIISFHLLLEIINNRRGETPIIYPEIQGYALSTRDIRDSRIEV